jgi:hypothetical protein
MEACIARFRALPETPAADGGGSAVHSPKLPEQREPQQEESADVAGTSLWPGSVTTWCTAPAPEHWGLAGLGHGR